MNKTLETCSLRSMGFKSKFKSPVFWGCILCAPTCDSWAWQTCDCNVHLLQMLSTPSWGHRPPGSSGTLWRGTHHPSAPGWARCMLPLSPEKHEVGDTDGKEDWSCRENLLGDLGRGHDLIRNRKWGWRIKTLTVEVSRHVRTWGGCSRNRRERWRRLECVALRRKERDMERCRKWRRKGPVGGFGDYGRRKGGCSR